jgi:hypothetical protein
MDQIAQQRKKIDEDVQRRLWEQTVSPDEMYELLDRDLKVVVQRRPPLEYRRMEGDKSSERKERPRWEYKVMTPADVRSLGKKDLDAGLNRLGDEGWELVGMDKDQCVLKRSK